MNNFLKAFLSFGLATSIEKILGFIILPIYTKYFSATEYGIIDLMGTIVQISAIFGILQLETALQRYYYDTGGLRRKYMISTIYFWISICSIAIACLVFLFSDYLSELLFESVQYSFLIKVISFQIPLMNWSMLGLLLLRFEKRNKEFLTVIVCKVITTLVFVYIFILKHNIGLKGVLYSQFLAIFFSSLLVTYFIKGNFINRWSRVFSIKSFKYALPQFPARLGSIALAQANRFFMLGFLTLASIGIYSVSLKLASSIQLVNTAFIMAWAPFMHAQFKNQNNREVFSRVFSLVVAISFFCVSIITLFSTELVLFLTDKEFYEAGKYIGGLTLFYAFYIIKETVDIGPKIKEKTKYLSYTFGFSVIVNILSLYILIRYFQIEGVVYAMMLTNFLLVVSSWFVSNKLYAIPFSKWFFTLLLIPTVSIVVLVMRFDFQLIYRVMIALFVCVLFGYHIFRSYFNVKAVI